MVDIRQAHVVVEAISKLIELAGASVIVCGIVLAAVLFVREGRTLDWRHAYTRFRSNLGRGILLGLELLVAADIIATITAPLTYSSVGLLAIVILIRTFLSFALEIEIEGSLPWRRIGQDTAKDKPR